MAPGAKEGESSFSIPNGAAIFRREPPNGGVKCRWGIGTNRDSGVIAAWLSKIAGRANCQKHLPRTKLCI